MSTQDFYKQLDKITRGDEDPRMHALTNYQEKMSARSMRADHIIRPKSSPELEKFLQTAPSTRKSAMALELRQKFSEVNEEKALLLHDILEAVDRDRMRKLEKKFQNMPTGGSSFHRGLRDMRRMASTGIVEKMQEKRRLSSIHQAWFIELLQNMPDQLRSDWFIQKVLDKLSKYGLVESSRQSTIKFRKVLETMRDWEICCPDVCAAVEFCRDKIVDMEVCEYEAWFLTQFPKVVRPQTAPPVMKSSENSDKLDGPKSAPPGARRRH